MKLILWEEIKGTQGRYKISNTGIVRNMGYYDSMGRYHKPKDIRSAVNTNGYLICTLGRSKKNQYVHRLVAKAFIVCLNPDLHINHKDGNKLNNNIENLEWITRSQNDLHKKRTIEFYRYPVLDTQTGVFYANAAEAYEYSGLKYSYGLFKDRITNHKRKNTTKYIRA